MSSSLRGSRNNTLLTIIIAAILISAAIAGGNWGVGLADTIIPTIPDVLTIDPDTVHVNSSGFTSTITGGNFVNYEDVLYSKVFFQEPNGGPIHEFTPSSITVCSLDKVCSTLTVYFPYTLFLNQGVATIWVKNYNEFGDVTGISGNIYMSIIDELFLPIIMKNS
jgi:hypothetical protein